MRTETRTTFCRICEALCGLEVDLEDGRIVRVRPDERHVATEGFACVKGLKQHLLYDSPDRLRFPEKRVGDRWERIGWDQANAEIGAKVRALKGEHGADSVGMYVGTAAGFGVLHPVFAQGFMYGLGSKSSYSSSTQDCSNKFAVARAVYGYPFTQPFPDLERTSCLIVVGANPVISKWSFGQVPHSLRRLQDIGKRGGRLFVVDPRRTETAKAGEHVFIRPNTDVFFFLAFLNELVAQGGVDRARLDRFTTGFDRVAELARPWTAERAEEVTRVGASRLREMVTAFRTSAGAAMYCSTGVNMGSQGALGFWLSEVINAASGNLDRDGGTKVGQGVFDFPAFGKKNGTLLRDDRSRVGGLRSVNDAFAGGVLADEILTPGKGQVRALFVTGGNPLITMANAGRLREAFGQLELLVTLDLFRNETGTLAHYNLPCTSPLQRPDLPFIFPLMLGLQLRPYLQATRPILEPQGEQRDEATIYLDLCRASGAPLFGSRVAQKAMEGLAFLHRGHRAVPQELLLSALLRVTGEGSFADLVAHPHGQLRPAQAAGNFLGERVLTDDGKVHLAPPELVEQAQRILEPFFQRELAQMGRFKLITKRAVVTQNSWTHNLEDFVQQEDGTNFLYMHPDDAARLSLAEGAFVDVSTDVGTVRVGLKLLSDLMPGTVALPHGWGHQHASGLSVAKKARGVNVNLLAADGPDRLDPLSGMAHLTGFVVDVRPAAGPPDFTSWSGLPQP
ncbi:MAG TPA: molybdopterin-dependent oxidoreductase [Myxococcales bacterium]|jgi:formate dehydrogenase